MITEDIIDDASKLSIIGKKQYELLLSRGLKEKGADEKLKLPSSNNVTGGDNKDVKEERSIEVEGTFTGQMPVVDGFSGAKWVSSDPTKAIVVESTGVVTGVAQGTAKITGKFTSPYETDGIVYNVTVTPKAQPANIFWG